MEKTGPPASPAGAGTGPGAGNQCVVRFIILTGVFHWGAALWNATGCLGVALGLQSKRSPRHCPASRTCHCLGQQGFPSARGPAEQHAGGWPRPQPGELIGEAQEVLQGVKRRSRVPWHPAGASAAPASSPGQVWAATPGANPVYRPCTATGCSPQSP